MNLLLDTHAFLYAATAPDRLSPSAVAALLDGSNRRLLSAATVWEIAIKVGKGALELHQPLPQLVASQRASLRLEVLPVRFEHALAVLSLPRHHRDPFDRMLIAQAQVEQAALVTNDRAIRSYHVSVVW